MSELLVETDNLVKRYGTFTAVDQVSLKLREGEVYGFLGPNGSGKSTTILMLLGLTEPSEGQARVCGFDPTREPLSVKRQVGYLPENVGFYGDLTGRENLQYTANLNGMPRIGAQQEVDRLLELVELGGAKNQLVGQYSRGMRQRLGLADVLLKSPRLAILDDPTLGLDPTGIQWLLTLIQEMAVERNLTVFLSSHQLNEVQQVCNRVGIMSHGKLVLEGTVQQLMAQDEAGGYSLELEMIGSVAPVAEAVRRIEGVTECVVDGSVLIVRSDQDIRSIAVRTVVNVGGELVELRAHNRTLEDIYLRYFQVP
jgi:ABC-2 type transport system ATP-binding protein